MARVLACSGLSFNGFALVIDKVVRNCVVLCVGSWGEAGHVCKARVRPRREMPRTGRPQTNLERSEEHTSELQSLMRISYAVFCLKKKKQKNNAKIQEYI